VATLTVWRYDTPLGANAGEVRLKALRRRGALTVHDAVTVAWLPGSHEPLIGHLHHASASAAGKGSALGALVGMLVLAPAVGAVVGAGAATLARRLRGSGIDQAFLDEIAAHLQPGCSALLVLSSDVDLDAVRPVVERGLATGQMVLLHAEVSEDVPAAIREAVREFETPPGRAT